MADKPEKVSKLKISLEGKTVHTSDVAGVDLKLDGSAFTVTPKQKKGE